MKRTVLTIASAAIMLTGCGGAQQAGSNDKAADAPAPKKSIVIYYSLTNTTAQVAKTFSDKLGIEIDSIVCNEPYDKDFGKTIQRWNEEREKNVLPAIKPISHNIADYDTIYLGYPIWGGTYPPAMANFIKSNDLKGKVLVPFCTFGSGGLNTSTDNLKAELPESKIIDGYGVRAARISKAQGEVETFLVNSGIVQGEKVVLPEFSEQQPVTDDDKKVFDAACGSYQMPLGTPTTVGKRQIKNGTEYLFNVESKGPDGNAAQSQIYVTAEENAAPEFTQVVR